MVQDKTYNRPRGRATNRYPTRNVIQQAYKHPTEENRAPQESALNTTRKTSKEYQLDEPKTNENPPPFLLNAIIDDDARYMDIKALVHGIEVLENKINSITCPTTGKQLEYRHLIQDPGKSSMEPHNVYISGQVS